MTVGELIELLEREDRNRTVVLHTDSGDCGYSPLVKIWAGSYRAASRWRGEAGISPGALTEEDREQGYSEEDVIFDGVPALVLVPVN